ncbi:MAG: hypothetical protein AB7F31_06215 [Parachlamydiales bacterium]
MSIQISPTISRYAYPAFCGVGLCMASYEFYREHQKGAAADNRVKVYCVAYALSCALDIGLSFRLLPHPRPIAALSAGAFLVGGVVRYSVASDRGDQVGRVTSIMDGVNALAFLAVGPNQLSMTLSVLSPALGLSRIVW